MKADGQADGQAITRDGSRHSPLPREMLTFLCLNFLLFAICLCFILYRVHYDASYAHGLIPTILSRPLFTDLLALSTNMRMLHDPGFFTNPPPWNYPAPAVFLYRLLLLRIFRPFPNEGELFYLVLVSAGLITVLIATAKTLVRKGLSTGWAWAYPLLTLLLSWPVFFGIRQGNIEALTWLVVAAAVWACFQDRWWLAAVLVGLVAGFKIYPILLLALFLKRRKYIEIGLSLLTFVLFNVAGLAYIGPTIPIAFRHIRGGVKLLTELAFYPGLLDRNYLAVEHSMVSLLRILTTAHPEYMTTLSRFYLPAAGLLMLIYYFAFIWKLPRTNQLLALSIAIVLLPPKSYDYTLVMLYVPWACLVFLSLGAARRGLKVKGLTVAMVLMALIVSPELYIKFQGYYSAGQFKTLCLLALLFVAARFPFPDLDGSTMDLRKSEM